MIYVKDSTYTDKRPTLNNVVSVDDNLLRAAGWGIYDESDLPEDRRHWVVEGNTITELSQEGKDAIAAQDLAEAEAQVKRRQTRRPLSFPHSYRPSRPTCRASSATLSLWVTHSQTTVMTSWPRSWRGVWRGN